MPNLTTRDGTRLRYKELGEGRPMILIHGWPLSADSWDPIMMKLAENGYRAIAYDRRGFGHSDHAPKGYDYDTFSDDLADVMKETGANDDVALVGFSMGGWAAAEIAVMNTRRFSKLVLVDSVGVKPGGPFDRDIADVFALTPAEQQRITWHDQSNAPDPATMTDEELQTLAANRVALGFYAWEPYMHNPKLPSRLHRIDIPTRLIWGEGDGIVSPDYGQAFCDMIPGASMVVIPNAGHSPHIEQPEEFVRHFLQFASC